MASSEKPDLVILDIGLPVMDGWQVARILKENPATQNIPIIALTAHTMAGDREKALEAGSHDYDTKPVVFNRLMGKIQRLLGEFEENDGVADTRTAQSLTPKESMTEACFRGRSIHRYSQFDSRTTGSKATGHGSI